MRITLASTEVELLPERGVYWPEARLLFLADLHLGKSEHFRQAGVPLPVGPNEQSLERIETMVNRRAVDRLIILGDFWHSRQGITTELVDQLRLWLDRLAIQAVEVVPGNHDAAGHRQLADLGVRVHPEALLLPPFVLNHYPEPDPRGYVLAGHLHPAVHLRGRGRQYLKLPCFWVRAHAMVLPAFGEFTGAMGIAPEKGDAVYAIAEDEVLRVPG